MSTDKTRIIDWLYGLQIHGIKLGLDNTKRLLEAVGNPQNSFKSVHIAGTDGKGSTSACIASILRASGFRTGLYTSPHILEFNERISVSGVNISDDQLAEYSSKLYGIVKRLESEGVMCTFFEVTTAMAFMHFENMGAEYAVIEVGMGGRFDATNVIVPEVTVIGNISLEHTEYLGDTIEKIAFEKAGTIKPGVPCVILNSSPASDVISRVAAESESPCTKVTKKDIEVLSTDERGTSFAYKGESYRVSIPGSYQAVNASLAVEAVSKLKVYGQCIRCNLKKGLESAVWPYRMQRVEGTRVILDVTHTSAGSAYLAKDVSSIYGKVISVFGALSDKDIDNMSSDLASISSKIFVAPPDTPRAASGKDLFDAMSRCTDNVTLCGSISEAMESAIRSDEEYMILVTGSFYTVEEASKWLKKISVPF